MKLFQSYTTCIRMKVPMVVDKGRSVRMEVEVGGGGGTVYTGNFHTGV